MPCWFDHGRYVDPLKFFFERRIFFLLFQRRENESLKVQRRKLTADKKQLAKDIADHEKSKESDKKRLEEDKKRLRRDKMLLEKAQKDKKSNQDRKAQEEIVDLQLKVSL